ncbi:BadF/BadG/BcrA/BcrD ATPase family protein [Streptomyces sp. S.PNR 29]|uniref:N-acetylglucosamine kinase n=1 Tax=Streptomyces sp. S.PNR 29 TaxID=2973805 RepID=UPI0025B05EE6|nr:BadF/BadG/BcrA/BcrD ATPase family protein [Streptomyces sp. S.PNR 29]MDN0197336.1 ATPase [Streptomyces sp. S.PNR 29]
MNSSFNQDCGQDWGDGPEGGLVVGLDAGGTRTRAVLAAARDGRSLGEGAAGPGNALTVPVPRLTEHLAEAVAQAVPEPARGRVVAVAGGFAGASGTSPDEPGRHNARTALTAALRGLGITTEAIGISSDIEAAFASAPGAPADGLALVAGTGAVAMRISGRRCALTVDGDGWLLGDDGSGFWIGRSAVRAALRMADGRGGPTVLAGSVARAFELPADVLPHASGDAWAPDRREEYRRRLLPAVMAQPPIRLARLAPVVAQAARDEDPVAEAILDRAADHLAESVRALAPRPGEPLVATGGLLGPDGPLTAPLADRLRPLGLSADWVADGCRGAVALARLLIGL